jgi:hypothetical protein
MNDSGIDVISPQLPLNSFNSSSTSISKHNQSASNNQFESRTNLQQSIDQDSQDVDEEDDDEIEEANKENKSSRSDKSTELSAAKPPKPYLEIIADAVLSCNVRMMQLHEIYNYMESRYPYFAKNINRSWRNSVRHNLSLNECFAKAGRGSNGKGNYWRIHPLVEKEFIRGNFRRKTFKKLIKVGSMNRLNGYAHPMSFTNPMEYCTNYQSNLPQLALNNL